MLLYGIIIIKIWPIVNGKLVYHGQILSAHYLVSKCQLESFYGNNAL